MLDTNILVVDDDKDSCASMSNIFLDLGYTVDLAYDSPGALELSPQRQRQARLEFGVPSSSR